MVHLNILRYGSPEPLPEQTMLRAGALSMVFENGDLRDIRWGAFELIRHIYAAVRDQNWDTVPATITAVQVESLEDAFRVTFHVAHQSDTVHFVWRGEILGEADGTVTFQMDGQALRAFEKTRIGFCVLHPAQLAGIACTLRDQRGAQQQAHFPIDLDPHQPLPGFTDLVGMAYAVGPVQVALSFEGDTFETEDQRNWSDASFKTYCTPLHLPYPVRIQHGTRIQQTIRIRTATTQSLYEEVRSAQPVDDAISMVLTEDSAPLPGLGLCFSTGGAPLRPLAIDRIRRLALDHLRVDLDLTTGETPAQRLSILKEAGQLSLPLHLALHAQTEEEIAAFAQWKAQMPQPVSTFLIYPSKESYSGGTPTAQIVAFARAFLPGPFAAGTDADFIFLQNNPPPLNHLQAVTFPMNPQVHTVDPVSIMQTLEIQGQMVRRAHNLGEGLPVMVSPITLKSRFNPYAEGPSAAAPTGALPANVDPRQMSLFTAAWTLGSIRAMAFGGAHTATYFETTGWRGVIESSAGSPVQDQFYSLPDTVFPVYFVFAAMEGFQGGAVIGLECGSPASVTGFGLRSGARLRVLLANLTAAPQEVDLSNLPTILAGFVLDETNAEQCMAQPEQVQPARWTGRAQRLCLKAYAVAWLDCDAGLTG